MLNADDAALLHALKEGRPGAFRELVDAHRDRVLNTCHRFLRDRGDAEDLAQEVFVEIHRSLGSFRGEAALSTWIYRIAVAKSLDLLRRRNRKKRFAIIRSLWAGGDRLERVAAPRAGRPDAEAERRERHRILQKMLDTLPETQRAAITLSHYEGFSRTETADILGTTVPAVDSLVRRAKEKLRGKLRRYYGNSL